MPVDAPEDQQRLPAAMGSMRQHRKRDRRSIRSALPQNGCRGHREDPQVAKDREVLDVLALHGKSLFERQVATPVHLHRPGQPRLYRKPEPVLGAVLLDELELLRSRPYEAHLASEHVEKLRQLVDARPPEEPPEARHARVLAKLEDWLLERVEIDERGQPFL